MEYTIQEEAQKILQLRDSILNDRESYNDAEFIRLKIEKKLRDEAKRTADYGKYMKSGRIDLIDQKRRNLLVTPISALQDAYYENYKPRKDRENETNDASRSSQRIPTLETFYDDDCDSSSNIIPNSSNAMKIVPNSTGLKPAQPHLSQSPIPQSSSPHLLNSQSSNQHQSFMNIGNFPPYLNSFPPQSQPVISAPPAPWSYEQQVQLIQNQAGQQMQQQQQHAAPFGALRNSSPFPFMQQVPQINQSPLIQPYQQFLPLQQQQQQQQPNINYGDGVGSSNNNHTPYSRVLPPQQQGQNRTLHPY